MSPRLWRSRLVVKNSVSVSTPLPGWSMTSSPLRRSSKSNASFKLLCVSNSSSLMNSASFLSPLWALNCSFNFAHQAQQTEGLDDRENKRVCVTGPKHALRGQCLVLVRRIVKHKQAYVVLRLANGSTQLVREEQTSAVQADLQSAAGLLLTVSALRMLSSMVAELHLATSKEATNDRTTAYL